MDFLIESEYRIKNIVGFPGIRGPWERDMVILI